jgi:glyoxylase-like metal-dependent hydrolase (beta-lactamase superfamily II)
MQTLHQLFDPASSTFTYLLADPVSRQAIIIDPVAEQLERDHALLLREGLELAYVLETHTHADHITSAGRLSELTGALSATPGGCGIVAAQRQLADGDTLRFGAEVLTALHTPGHTAGSMSYLWRDCVFTGDALLIGGCGRTDFQSGDAGALYDSITKRLFALPDATRVYPAHDYNGRTVSTIGHERAHNARISGRTREEFIALMASLNLPMPRMIERAVPANRQLGLVQG